MKVVILAGGFGTRISEESTIRPKPLVEIGGRPILWHIMKIYSAYGLNDFVICGGYKCNMIKSYFHDYMIASSDVTFDLRGNTIKIHRNDVEPWNVTLIDTGELTMTGGRVKRVRNYLGDEPFCLTYGDGVSDVDMDDLIAFHKRSKALATVTAVRQPGRFGALRSCPMRTGSVPSARNRTTTAVSSTAASSFSSPRCTTTSTATTPSGRTDPYNSLAREGKLVAYRHNGYWQNMDTLRDRNLLEGLWQKGSAPWKIW